jgi:hypothetical protein
MGARSALLIAGTEIGPIVVRQEQKGQACALPQYSAGFMGDAGSPSTYTGT